MLRIHTYPEAVLRQVAEPVDSIDAEILELIDDMAGMMYDDDGVGLAAPQAGISRRLIVVDAGEGFNAVINPEIIIPEDHKIESMEEGCLSLPEIRVDIKRPDKIILKGLDANDKSFEKKYDGLMARVFQHEVDHLNGKMIIDHASTIQRALLRKQLKRLEKRVS